MYTPRHFAVTDTQALHQHIQDRSFATLITLGIDGPEADHLPFLLSTGEGSYGTLQGHVARGNPLWRNPPADRRALVIFNGPDAYISPNWYPSKAEGGKAVPTWNYSVVHAHGDIRFIEDADWLDRHLNELTNRHEAGRPPAWKVADAPKDYIDKLKGAIVGIEIPIIRLEGKLKASQNRSAADREGVLRGMESEGQSIAWLP